MDHKSNVLILLGSPRKKGNSAALADAIAQGAEDAGAKVISVYLNSMNISPCQACDGCRRKEGRCIVDDDMQSIYPLIESANAIVYVSPVYWFTVSAQLKSVMDRCYAYGSDGYKALAGKKAAAAMSYGDADAFVSGCVNALRTFQDASKYVGMDMVGMVYGSADAPGEIEKDAALMARSRGLGKKLAS